MRGTIKSCLILAVLSAAAGCSGNSDSEVQPGASSARVSGSEQSVLGFEDVTLWQGPGYMTSSSDASEGAAALAIVPKGYAVYRSAPIAFRGNALQVALDLKIPNTQSNPTWSGTVEFFVDSPSAGLYSAPLGLAQNLKNLQVGVYNTLKFDVPQWIRERLSRGVSDLRLKVAMNVSSTPAVYLLDNIRLRTDLIAHYRFDDAASSTVAADSSGWDRSALLRGAARLDTAGRSGSALQLDGSSAYAELPNGLLDGSREITVATWVQLAQRTAWSRIFDFGGASGFSYLTPATHEPLLRFSTYAGNGNEGTVTAPPVAVGVWKHVAVTSSGRDYRVYIDGVEAANALTVPATPADMGANTGNWIGRSRFPDPLLAGRIDDFRVYSRALSRQEVAALAHPGGDYANWRFDERTGTTVSDQSSSSLHGTTFGNVSWTNGVVDGALTLAGDGAHVQLPAGPVENCTDFTLSSWIRLRTNRPWNRVFDFGKPDFSSFMYLSTAGFGPSGQELRFGLIAPNGVHDVGYPTVLPLQEWTHVAVTLRGETATLFLNGRAAIRQNGVVANPSDMGTTIGNFFGRSTFADPTFDGALDDVRLSCRAFADSEIEQLAHLPAPSVLPNQLPVSGDIQHVHDPAVIATASGYRLFSTGPGVLMRTSPDLSSWSPGGPVFAENPAWITERFGAIDSLWAPDISFFGGTHHLYYAASSFGSNRSCIGHATKADLDSNEPWEDRGPVICSNFDGAVNNYNAIDANVVLDANGTPWMSFGSFWSGLKMIRLDQTGARADGAMIDLASRPSTAIEAPFIVYRAPYYYMFASFDSCCQGANSTYRQVVGRSTSVTGPYLDRTGLDMRLGGGTPVVSGSSRWRGPGHNAVIKRGDQYLNVYHSYDALNNGIPTLRISELIWQEGWPLSAEP